MSASRVVVVGGGVVGAACAYYLSRAGWRVTVVDAGAFGSGCSLANCGLICPSHVLPLAGPGAVREAWRSLWHPRGPFSIRLRLDCSLWAWLAEFLLRCNRPAAVASGRARQPLLSSSFALYRELIQEEGIQCEWQERGLLFVLPDPAAMAACDGMVELIEEVFPHSPVRYDGQALVEFEPALKPGLAGGWYYRGEAHLRPDRLMTSWRRVLETRGVEIWEHRPVRAFSRRGRVVVAAETAQGPLRADAFVIAAGAYTPPLSRRLGWRVPIQPGKGYSMTTAYPACRPRVPLLFPAHRVAVTPMQSAYRLGSIMELAGYDLSLDHRRLRLLVEGAAVYLRAPHGQPIQETWCGLRPLTADGLPFIDRYPNTDNAYVAAGHNMVGMSMAPATGKLIAELLSGQPPHVDPAPYCFDRLPLLARLAS